MTPTLHAGYIRLLPFKPAMVSDFYVSWLNDPETVCYSEQRHRVHTRASCEAFVASIDHERTHLWAIHKDAVHVGNISAHRDVPNRTADVGILVGRRHWGCGAGSAAWDAVVSWLLSDGGCRMVTAGTMIENVGMMTIFDRTGFRIDGRRPGYFLLNGRPVDMVLASKRRQADGQ